MPYQIIEPIWKPVSITAGVHVFPFILSDEEVIKRDKKFFVEFEGDEIELVHESDEKLLEEIGRSVATFLKPNEVVEVFIFIHGRHSGGFLRKPVPIGERALNEIAGVVATLREAVLEAERVAAFKPKKGRKK